MVARYRQSPNDGPMLADEAGPWVKVEDISPVTPSYLTNCFVKMREGDTADALFRAPGGDMVVKLDGYAIVPKVEYDAIVAAPSSGTLEATAQFLFALLDDIDTLDDACKENDEAFRKAVYAVQRRRFEVASTDGYTITFTALAQPPEAERAVAVNALEWASEPPYRVARPFAGLHYATEVVWPENGSAFDYVLLSGPTIGSKRFASLTDAQAAAQADFERRIRSALTPSLPQAGADSEKDRTCKS